MNRILLPFCALLVCAASFGQTLGASSVASPPPPQTWVDKDTGHRIVRITDEPRSSGFYFNVNAYSSDGRWMVYTAPDGIHTVELTTLKTRLLVKNPPPPGSEEGPWNRNGLRTIVVGRKTNSVFYSQFDSQTGGSTIYKANLDTGEVTKLTALPPRAGISTINADETLGAGAMDEMQPTAAQQSPSANRAPNAPLVQAEDKSSMMERRLAARIPVVLFTVNLQTGEFKPLLHSTDWIGHLLFSPRDPTLLMYCHEGPWHKVDRIWTIRTDGLHNELMHKRTMTMEIAGHEFWGIEGDTVWYDWQLPKGEDFWLASFNLDTHERSAYHMQRDEWSIHFNLTQGGKLFAGDGGDPGQVAHSHNGQWINLFRPELKKNADGLDDPSFIHSGIFHSERLVNMAHHDYHLEPNVRISPDRKWVFFTSNMFGPSYVFGVEVDKATDVKPEEIKSTPDLGRVYGPDPKPTPDDK